jgi:hypothetical protein
MEKNRLQDQSKPDRRKMAISTITQVDIAGDHFQIHYVRNTSGDESRGLYSRKRRCNRTHGNFGCCAALPLPMSETNRAVLPKL